MVRLTFHMPDVFDRLPYNIFRPYFTTLRLLAMKVDYNPSLQSFPIDTSSPGCRWRKMCAVLDVGVSRVFRFSNSLWISCMSLLPGSINWGAFLSYACC